MSTLIITTCDGLEPLLTGSIPNLELNGLSININSSNFEVDTNGWHEIIIENIVLYLKKVMRVYVEISSKMVTLD